MTEWWNDDNNKKEISYKDGKLNGLYTELNKNSNKIKEGSYVNELMEGEWDFYFFNINTERWESLTGSFKSGDGGNPHENSGVPINGRHGLFTGFNENGQKRYEGNYKDGIQIGKFEFWFDDGIKEWEYYFNDDGTRDSTKLITRWYESGQKWFEGYVKTLNDKIVWNGLYTEWHENGQKKEEATFKDGKEDGLLTDWYENGQKKMEGTYNNGKQVGQWTYLLSNGQKWREGTFKDGIKDGKWTRWYDNGQMKQEGTYKNHYENGKWTFYYENGQIREDGNYKDGQQDGKWTYYNKDGSIKEVKEF